jgi:hypothetical protein
MKKIGKYVLPIFFVLLAFGAKAQKNISGSGLHEFGAGIGGLNYTGELSPGFNPSFFRPGGIFFYRYNISPVVSFRFSGLMGLLQANERNNPDPLNTARSAQFSTSLGEFATTFEYNFLNYRPKETSQKAPYNYSPFITMGFAWFVTEHSGGQMAVPIGIGMKYKLNRRLNLGMEFVARKTFTDRIDGINSYFLGSHQTANRFDNDWYYFAGFTISYTAYSVICPFY